MSKIKTESRISDETTTTEKMITFMRFPKGIQRELDVPDITQVTSGVAKAPVKKEGDSKGDDGNKGGNKDGIVNTGVAPEYKSYQETVLKENEGTSFNDTGALVDKDGKVLKSAEDLKKEFETKGKQDSGSSDTAALVIDGDDLIINPEKLDELHFDDKGNLLDKEGGQVVLEKEKYEEFKAGLDTNDDGDDSALAVVQAAVEVEVLGEDGNPKTYDNTPEGINQYIKDATQIKVSELVRQEQEKFLNSNPHLKAFAEHLHKGGNPKSWSSDIHTWESVDIAKDDNEQHLEIIVADLIRSGNSKERAAKLAKTLVDGGDGFEEAKVALKSLQDADKAERVAAVKAQQEADNRMKEETQKFWGEVDKTVKGRVLGSGDASIKIPETEVNAFLKYVTQPVTDQGHTQEMLDRGKEPMSVTLLNSYLQYKGYNFADLVKLKASQGRVLKIKSMSAAADRTSGTVVLKKSKGTPLNFPDINSIKTR